jgi:chemotaxis protein histidine kinase CheA
VAFDKSKFLNRFIDEAREHITKLNDGLLGLEKNPGDADTLNGVFRSAHTIKGSSRMMKLIPISEVAHKLEDALDALRQNKIEHSKTLSDLFLKGVDTIERMLDQIASGDELSDVPSDLCDELEKAAQGHLSQAAAEPHQAPESQNTKKISAGPPPPAETPQSEDRNDPKESLKRQEIQPAETPPLLFEKPLEKRKPDIESDPLPPGKNTDRRFKPPETIRISAEKLDELIKLMGEIVSGHSRSKQRLLDIKEVEKLAKKNADLILLLENETIQSGRQKEDLIQTTRNLFADLKKLATVFKEELNVQGLLTSDLQDKSLKMRMMPLSTIFDSFPRTVRDIVRGAGKEVDFIIEGGETELDKKMIEKIGAPLLHMLRNCIDHGIEKPDERIRAGKSAAGTIRLAAGYEGENVVIRLSDDGAGIPLEKLRDKAIKKKIFDKAEAENLPDAEVINLIFIPGFSSSDIVTDLSGRGVGMDVVKKDLIEDLKGAVQIETRQGKGTCFHIRLPLTMAIIHVLFIRVSGMTFAIPANFIEEIIRATQDQIIHVMDKKAVRVRDQIIPVVRLDDILKLPFQHQSGAGDDAGEMLALIASMGSEKLGLIIDALLDEDDMVIKPLPSHMRNIELVSGCIISGTNEIFNVLHIPRIIQGAKDVRMRRTVETAAPEDREPIHILVVDDSLSTREIEKSILESYGYQVTLAGDGRDGFDQAMKFKYDLIITDVEMPNMDGFSLTEKLREEEGYRNTPIILVTSLDKEEDKKRGIRVGADAYIVKGDFEQSALIDTVRNLAG